MARNPNIRIGVSPYINVSKKRLAAAFLLVLFVNVAFYGSIAIALLAIAGHFLRGV